MNFKPGDKVWLQSNGESCPAGDYKAIILGLPPTSSVFPKGWWLVDIDGVPYSPTGWCAHEKHIRPRFDPPPQQEPTQQREPVGEWELCPWRPVSIPIESL